MVLNLSNMTSDILNRVLGFFPITNVVKNYNLSCAISDLVAGITVGLTLIPQSLAYTGLAGLDPQYGLYSSLMGGVVYLVFGTVPELNLAPTALLSLLTYSYTHNVSYSKAQAATLLCFLSGVIEVFCGLLKLGFLVDFVSTPVVAAFTSSGAITIASSQVKNLLGLRFSAESFISVWQKVFQNIQNVQVWDAVLGCSCCIILLLLRKLKDFGSPLLEKEETKDGEERSKSKFKKIIWFLSVSRNALVVILSGLLAFCLSSDKPFSLTRSVESGLPSVSFPKFEAVSNNGTEIRYFQILEELGSGILVIPFIAILANVAIAKAFANGKAIDASQEMLAVGMCNLVGSMFGSFPVSASFSRAAVSNASSVRTPVAGLYTSTMVILALTFLTPFFMYIPKSTLSAVVICAVLFMIEVELTQIIWKTNKMDFIPFTVTLVSCLFISIEVGILIGISVDVMLLLYYNARPKVLIEKTTSENGIHFIKVTPLATTLFPSAEFIRERIMHHCNVEAGENYKYVVFDCYRMRKIDFTAAKCLSALILDLEKAKKSTIFYRPRDSVEKVIKNIYKKELPFIKTEVDLFSFMKDKEDTITAANSNLSLACNGKELAEKYTTVTTSM